MKISSREKSFLQKFLADDKLRKPTTLSSSSGSHNLTEQKIDSFYRRNIEPTVEIFCDLQSTCLSFNSLLLVSFDFLKKNVCGILPHENVLTFTFPEGDSEIILK